MRFIITVIFVLISAFLSAAEFIGNHKTVPAGTLQIIQVDNPEEVGDIYLLKTPEGKFFLVDTGLLHTGERVLIPALKKYGVKRLEAVIITHFHSDHAGGLVTLLNDSHFEIGSVLYTAPYAEHYSDKFALRVEKLVMQQLKRNHIPAVELKTGDVIRFSDGIKGDVVGSATLGKKRHLNNNSLVFRLVYGNFSMLFTGDCEFEQEKLIMASKRPLKSDILKASHHGMRGSTSAGFLNVVAPKMVVLTTPEALSDHSLVQPFKKLMTDRKMPYYPSWKYPELVIFSDGKTFGLTGGGE